MIKRIILLVFVCNLCYSGFSQCEGSIVSHKAGMSCVPDSCYDAIVDGYEALMYKSDKCDTTIQNQQEIIEDLRYQSALKDTAFSIVVTETNYIKELWQKELWDKDLTDAKLSNAKTWNKVLGTATATLAVITIIIIKISVHDHER